MATDSNINLGIRVSTAVAGLAGFDHLRASIGGVAKSAGLANTNLAKMAIEFGAIVLAFKGVESITSFFKGSIEQAKAARDAQEKLGIALNRNPKLAAKGAEFIAEQQTRLTQLAETMDRQGVLAATSLTAGFAGLSRAGFSPDSIERMSKGFEGVAISLRGVAATAPEVADVAKSVQMFIKTGRVGELRQFFTKEQLANVTKMKSETQRATFAMGWLEKQGYRTADAMETAGAKQAIATKNWQRLQETLGQPFLDVQLQFSVAMGELANALEPAAKQLAALMTPAMKDFANWIKEQTPNIQAFGQMVTDAMGWIVANWGVVSKGLGAIGVGIGALAVVAVVTNPLTLMVAALSTLAAGVVAVIENWDKIGPAIEQGMQAIAKATEWLWKPITTELGKVWPEIEAELKRMVKLIESFFTGEIDLTALGSTLTRGIERIGTSLGKVDWGKMVAGITEGFSKIDWAGIASVVMGLAGQAFQNAVTSFAAVGASIASAFSNIDWSGVANVIGQGIGEALKLIAWATFILPQDIHNAFVGVVSGIDWSGVGKNIVSSLGAAANNAMAAAGWLGEIGIQILTGIVTSIAGQDWGKVAEVLARGFAAGLGGILKEVASWGPRIRDAILSGIGTLIPKFELPFGLGKGGGGGGTKAITEQYGGLVAHPSIATLAESGPEMVIPLNNRQRSQGLLSQTAQMLGMGGPKGGGGGPTNINVSMPINVSGAQAGQGEEIAREIQRAMQDPIREMLDQLRAARDEEQRLSYV